MLEMTEREKFLFDLNGVRDSVRLFRGQMAAVAIDQTLFAEIA